MTHDQHPKSAPPLGADLGVMSAEPVSRGLLSTAWNGAYALIGAFMGLLPHVLHHVSLFAGAAVVTGLGGNLLFGALGLLLSVPLLRRLYRRFGTWKAPGIAVALFAAMFALAAFGIGPAIVGSSPGEPSEPARTPGTAEHTVHHDE